MKLIATRKPRDSDVSAETLNSVFGNSFKVVPDNEAEAYIAEHVGRGFVCFEFDHTGTYQRQTTVVKSQAA